MGRGHILKSGLGSERLKVQTQGLIELQPRVVPGRALSVSSQLQ